jgi:hypothetical protein
MSPEDVAVVDRSWAELRLRDDALVDRLAVALAAACPAESAANRARWLVDSVGELVGLLTAPSQLGRRARLLALARPCPGSAPSFRVDGQAWMIAAPGVCATWTAHTERAWRHAWLLLSDVLAEESLSPFASPSPQD